LLSGKERWTAVVVRGTTTYRGSERGRAGKGGWSDRCSIRPPRGCCPLSTPARQPCLLWLCVCVCAFLFFFFFPLSLRRISSPQKKRGWGGVFRFFNLLNYDLSFCNGVDTSAAFVPRMGNKTGTNLKHPPSPHLRLLLSIF